MKKNILIVGRVFNRLTSYLSENGYEYTCLIDSAVNIKLDSKNTVCDFSDSKHYINAAKSLDKINKIDGVITTYENYILPTAEIAKELGLPHIPLESAKACTDKEIMRTLFSKSIEHISPDFMVVKNIEDLQKFAEEHNFPLILKPANLAKSLLVTKNHDITELLNNYESTINQASEIYKKYAPNKKPKIIIEEFLEGSIHSVDAFIGSDGEPKVLDQVVDYQTGYDVGYDDNFHYSRLLPTKLSQEIVNKIKQVAVLGCKSLGMKNTAAHVEIILTKNGPKLVEIGARNGGYRERMHELANGIDVTGTNLKVITGEKFSIKANKNEPCAVIELFPKISGNFAGISNLQELENLESLAYFNTKVKLGDLVGKSSKGHKMCAVIALHNSDTEQFNKDLEYVNKHVYVETI